MFGNKMKLKIEQEYKRHFVLGENSMENVQQSCNLPVKTEVKIEVLDQPVQDMAEVQQEQKYQPPDGFSVDEDSDTTQEDGNSRGKGNHLRFFNRKPRNYQERRKKDKDRKARQLRRFRKFLMPKNAIMALHELQSPSNTEFILKSDGQQTKAEITINNVKYEATAANKTLAKAKASEKALREVFYAQVQRVKEQRIAQLNQQQQLEAGPSGMQEAKVNSVKAEVEAMECIEVADLPMEHLASFALHKMFLEWEEEGFLMPFRRLGKATVPALPEKGTGTSIVPKVAKTAADLPPNATTYNPSGLFAYMRPQTTFEDLGMENDQQNREFTVGLRSDGHYFIGKGRSKKLARKAAAIDACKELFGVTFVKSAPNVSTETPIPSSHPSPKNEA